MRARQKRLLKKRRMLARKPATGAAPRADGVTAAAREIVTPLPPALSSWVQFETVGWDEV